MSEIKWGKCLWSTAPAIRCSGQWAMGLPARQAGLSLTSCLRTCTHSQSRSLTHSHNTQYTHCHTDALTYTLIVHHTQSHHILPLVRILAHTLMQSHTLTLLHTHTLILLQSHSHTLTPTYCGLWGKPYFLLGSAQHIGLVESSHLTGGDAAVQKQ